MSRPQVITSEILAAQAVARHAEQYAAHDDEAIIADNRLGDTREQLKACNGEVACVERVLNAGWVTIHCDGCGHRVRWAVQVGDAPDYGSATASLCRECLMEAAALALDTAPTDARKDVTDD